MLDKGWMHVIDKNPHPISVHICTMPQNDGQIELFAKDLADTVRSEAVPIGELSDETFDLYGNLDLDI